MLLSLWAYTAKHEFIYNPVVIGKSDCLCDWSCDWFCFTVGKTSNCAVVMAQLVIDGQPKGMAPFLVHLRDIDTHLPLEGMNYYITFVRKVRLSLR